MSPEASDSSWPLPGGPPGTTVRRARAEDLPALVALLADDALGRTRETSDLAPYHRAFDVIDGDPQHLLAVAVADGEVTATLQLSVVPGLARAGALRGQIEAVRVRADQRGLGTGTALVRWAVEQARHRGCALVQLTTDKTRAEALRFYGRLDFVASHEGLKLSLGR
jgi:GNAT superfamily N-acetyltransferase